MCGIAGIFNLDGYTVPFAQIKAMCTSMKHRGPDGEGIYLDGAIGLGHRRLKVIDLSPAGHQPMWNEDGTMALVYNGEVYNFQELRTELQGLGHYFRSKTDSEAVLHAYEEWGTKCLDRFNGIFAFALWNTESRTLFLARDQYGVKPLYYRVDAKQFIFASEIKAILATGVKAEVSLPALGEYFTFQNIYSNKTLFKGIKMLPAGHFAYVDTSPLNGMATYEYWDYPQDTLDIAFDDATVKVRELLEQAVTRQLVSDVPLGSYLSGGMDSGSIVATARQHIPRLMTFTGGFDLSHVTDLELGFDERNLAEVMSSQFKTEHYEMVIHDGDMAHVLPKLVWHLEDLRMGMSHPNWYIARLASKFVKVALSGAGGDELFGGYPWRYMPLLSCPTVDEFDSTLYRCWQRLAPATDRKLLFTAKVLDGMTDPRESLEDVLTPLVSTRRLDREKALRRALYFEAKTFLHGLFVVEDKLSMAHSLETRVPFLDNDLVDFVWRLPARYKVNMNGAGSKSRFLSSDGKVVLRRAMKGFVPEAVLRANKQGFSSPDESWYRYRTTGYIRRMLLSEKAKERGYFQPEYVEKVIGEHVDGKVNHRLLIWSLLCFEWWNRIFIDGETV